MWTFQLLLSDGLSARFQVVPLPLLAGSSPRKLLISVSCRRALHTILSVVVVSALIR